MPTSQTKGITVKIDAALHAEIKAYLEQNEMTMSEFIALAVQDELHPKIQETEVRSMENMRTLAFQVPESLFQRIKDYLKRNGMTQKAFVLGLIEEELDRDEELLLQQEQGQEDAEEEQDDSPVEAPTPDFAPQDSRPEYDPQQEEGQAVGSFGDGSDGPDEEQEEGPLEDEMPDFVLEDGPQQEEEQAAGGFEDEYDRQAGDPDNGPVEEESPGFALEDSPQQEEEQTAGGFEDGYDGPTEEPDDGPVEEESPDFALEDSPQQEEEQTTGGFEDGYDSQAGEPDAYFSAEDGQEEYDPSQNEEETEEEYMGMSM